MTRRYRLVLAVVPLAVGAYLSAPEATPVTPSTLTRAAAPTASADRDEPALATPSHPATRAQAPAAEPIRPAVAPPPSVRRDQPPTVAPAPRPVTPGRPGAARADSARPPSWYACRVTVDEGGGRVAVGSGTPVHAAGGKTLVLTNAHVVPADRRDDALTVAVGGRAYPAQFVAGSAVAFGPDGRITIDGPDLSVLEVDGDLGAVPVAAGVSPGEAVSQAGYGGTRAPGPPVVRRGRVTSVGAEVALSYPVEPGDSGSGVLNAAGELVGVTTGRDPETHLGSAIPATRVRAFLLQPRIRTRYPAFAEQLEAAADAGTTPPLPAVRPAAGDGLPEVLRIEGKTYTRVPGSREYVEARVGSVPPVSAE